MHVDNWISQIKQHAELKADTILVANKCDLDDQRVSELFCLMLLDSVRVCIQYVCDEG